VPKDFFGTCKKLGKIFILMGKSWENHGKIMGKARIYMEKLSHEVSIGKILWKFKVLENTPF
jgi:hypothetical protein